MSSRYNKHTDAKVLVVGLNKAVNSLDFLWPRVRSSSTSHNRRQPRMADGTDSKRASGKEPSGGATALPLHLTPLPPNMPLLHNVEETRRKLEDELSVQKYLRIACEVSSLTLVIVK